MFIYDFDFPEEWVARFYTVIKSIAPNIVQEIERQRQWELADMDVRLNEPKPPAPKKDAVLREISEDFNRNSFRAFHATRLFDPEAVRHEGLRALRPDRQIEHMQRNIARQEKNQNMQRRQKRWENWSKETDSFDAQYRQGSCWLVPSRKLLHDGGLDCQFERVGGEFIERISADPYRSSTKNDFEPGRATVVVAVIPSNRCWQAPKAGPIKILYETKACLGRPLHENFASLWDVKVDGDIPPQQIELVCARDDKRVATPAHRS